MAFEWFVYDSTECELTAQFRNGSRYIYKGVPPSVTRKLFAADSVGQFFNEASKGKYVPVRVV